MTSITIPLLIEDSDLRVLRKQYEYVRNYVETNAPLDPRHWRTLVRKMGDILRRNPAWHTILLNHQEHYHIHLQHSSIEVLNFPWEKANPGLNFPLEEYENIKLGKILEPIKKNSLIAPSSQLRILVCIASSEYTQQRLDYEGEIKAIRDACATQEVEGKVQIDICPDGSLKTLRKYLDAEAYHMLHFSGHGTYRPFEKQAYLVMEDSDTLLETHVPAQEFVKTIQQSTYGNRLAMVMLAACRTADEQGVETRMGESLSKLLLEADIPFVGGMALNVEDQKAVNFAGSFYQQLVQGVSVVDAWEHARSQFSGITRVLVPQLYYQYPDTILIDPAQDKPLAGQKEQPSMEIRGIPDQQNFQKRHMRFIGRRKEIAQAVRAIHKHHPVSLYGFAGVGKTTLALEIAFRHASSHQLYYIDTSHASLPLIEGYDLNTYTPEEWPDLLDRMTMNHPMLIIFDHLDGNLNADFAASVLEFLSYCIQHSNIETITVARRIPDISVDHPIRIAINHPGEADFGQKTMELGMIHQVQTYGYQRHLYVEFYKNYALLEQGFDYLVKEGMTVKEILDSSYGTQIAKSYSDTIGVLDIYKQLDQQAQLILLLLSQFPIPVIADALSNQSRTSSPTQVLQTLHELRELGLAESREDPNINDTNWEVPWILKEEINNLASSNEAIAQYFSLQIAGDYFAEMYETYDQARDLEVGFHYWLHIKDLKRLKEHGPAYIGHLFGTDQITDCLTKGIDLMKVLGMESPAELHNLMGMALRHTDRVKEGIQQYQLAAGLAKQQGKDALWITLRHNTARILISYGYWAEAQEIIEDYLPIASSNNNWEAEANAYSLLSQITMEKQGNTQEGMRLQIATQYIQKAIETFETRKKWVNLASALVYHAQILSRQGELDQMKEALLRSIELADIVGNPGIKSRGVLLLGKYHALKGEMDLNNHQLKRAYHIAKQMGDTQTINEVLQRRVQHMIINRASHPEMHIQEIEKYLEEAKKTGDLATHITMLNTLGHACINTHQYEQAIHYLQQILDQFPVDTQNPSIANAHSNIGQAYRYSQIPQQAISHMQTAYQMFSRMGDEIGKETTSFNLGEILLEAGQPRDAVIYLGISADISQKIGNPEHEKQARGKLLETQRIIGDVHSARLTEIRLMELFDS